MIGNEVKQQELTSKSSKSKVTSPISKTSAGRTRKKDNAIMAWLNDKDDVDENYGIVNANVAVTSYIKGLAEIIKTLYKKPIVSIVTIATAALLTYKVGYNAVTAVMGISAAAGVAGIIYSVYSLINSISSNDTKQAYEVLGISSFVLAVAIYGLVY